RSFAAGMLLQPRGAQLDTSGSRMILEDRAAAVADVDEQRQYAVWDIASDSAVFRIPGDVTGLGDVEVWDPRFWDDDTLLAFEVSRSTDENGEPVVEDDVILIDLVTGAVTRNVLPDGTFDVVPIAGRAFTLGETGTVQQIDKTTFDPVGPEIQLPAESPPFTVATGVGGATLLLTQWDGVTRSYLYDAETGDLLAELDQRDHAAWISPAGEVFTASNVEISRRSGETLEVTGTVAHLAGAATLEGTADGDIMIARGGRGGVGIIDVATLRPYSAQIPADNFGDAAITEDGSAVIVPTRLGMAIWSLDPADHFEAACRIAGRDMTEAEWATYLPELGERVETCAEVLG
ncbi:MAG: hypothetical protein ACRCSL_12775, partial [Microbacterium sp.]